LAVELRDLGHPPGVSPGAVSPAQLNAWVETRLVDLAGAGPVLDVGCGRGFWLHYMADRGIRSVGIEEEVDRVREGLVHAPVVAGDGARLPVAPGSCSLVWCIHVLHHLDDPAMVLSEARRVLAPGGHLILAETVEDNPAIRIGRRVWPHWDGVPIRSRFTAQSLLDRLSVAGFDVVESRQHSLTSFAAWALPGRVAEKAWAAMSRLEERLVPARLNRFGAHLEVVARTTR
jgi:SAM-dependent methyltransferase